MNSQGRPHDTDPERTTDLLQQLIDDEFWGSLEIKFEAGRIVLARKPKR